MSAPDPALVDRLAAHRTLGGVPRAELEWLAAHGELREAKPGEVMSTKGVPVESLYVVLEGQFAIFVDRGAGRHKAMEWHAGDVAGILPYSRLTTPPGDSIAQTPLTVLSVDRGHFPAMIRECHEVTSILVHRMLDRARAFTSSALHDEKLVSLGKLSAGLSHELNNPAAAIERSAALLQDRLDENEQSARALGAQALDPAQLAAVEELRTTCLAARKPGVRSPIEHAEREDEFADWLTAHGLDPLAAEPLADTAVTIESLDRIAAVIEGRALAAVVRWAAAGCAVRALAADIQEASMRISGLVLAIKGFTHMDQAAVAEPVDVARGLANTVVVLGAKARKRSIAVAVDVEPGLPRARGFAGELNQIWANLIDNALDAAPEGGRVEVRARREQGRVVVRVTDDGGGIPPEIRDRIFDPFFTTKPIGEGTGLGLDIVHRLVRHNDGEIAFDSKPGRTEFQVALQVAPGEPA
jgi:signal transduction histidine kinase